MPLSSYRPIAVPTDDPAILALVEEINQSFDSVYEGLRGLYGAAEKDVTLTGDIDLDGHGIHNLSRSSNDGDPVPRFELIAKGLYQNNDGKHVAAGPIYAPHGVFLDSTRTREPNEAVTKVDVDRAITDYVAATSAPSAHTHPWSDITSTPTTLAGYGITDAQPLDSDLTAIAALTTTAFGRALLTETNASTARTTLGLVIGTNVQAWDADLDTWATKTAPSGTVVGTSDSQSLTNKKLGSLTTNGFVKTSGGDGTLSVDTSTYLTTASAAATYQPLDPDLTTWAAITRASGFDTFVATPSSANLAALLTDETGTGAAVFATSPTLVTPNIGAATGTSLDLSGGGGSISLAQAQNVWLGGSAAGFRISQNGFAEMVFGANVTDAMKLSASYLAPASAGGLSLGRSTAGFSSLYLDEAGAGTETAQIIAPTLSGNIVVTLPAATGTLARTDGDAIGSTTPAAGSFTTLKAKQGSASDTVNVGGTVYFDNTPAGNSAGGADTDLRSYSLAASTLVNTGDRLEGQHEFVLINARGRIVVGSTTIYDSGAGTTAVITVKWQLYRDSATSYIYSTQAFNDTADTMKIVSFTAGTATWSGAVTIKGVGNGTSANDATLNAAWIVYFPTNT